MLELKDICVSFRSERQDKLFGTSRDQVLFDVSLQVERLAESMGKILKFMKLPGDLRRNRKRKIDGWTCPLRTFKTGFRAGASGWGGDLSKPSGEKESAEENQYCFSGLYNLGEPAFPYTGYSGGGTAGSST